MYIKSVCAHVCLCLCMCSVSAGSLGGQKEVLNTLVLDLQAGVSHLMWCQIWALCKSSGAFNPDPFLQCFVWILGK